MLRDTPNISFRNNRAYNDSDGLVVLCHFGDVETVMSVSVKQWMRMCVEECVGFGGSYRH